MWALLLFIAFTGFAAGYFFGWYMCEETDSEPFFPSGDDADKFYLDEQLAKYKADDNE